MRLHFSKKERQKQKAHPGQTPGIFFEKKGNMKSRESLTREPERARLISHDENADFENMQQFVLKYRGESVLVPDVAKRLFYPAFE